MSFIGVVSDGPGADSQKSFPWPGIIALAAGQQLFPGQLVCRNYTAVQGKNDERFGVSTPSLNVGDQVVLPTAASAGYVYGVMGGVPYGGYQNPLAPGVSQNYIGRFIRSGLVPVLAAALSGGTAITIGASVGKSAATGASSSPYAIIQAAAIGQSLGIVCGYPIDTYFTANAAVGSNAVAVANMAGISTSTALTINPGLANQETVTPSAVTQPAFATNAITFTSTATGAGTVTATFTGTPLGTIVVTAAIGATNTVNQSAIALANAINASLLVANVAPSILFPGGGLGTLNYVPAPGAGVVNLAAINPGTAGNNIGLTVSTTAATQTVAATGANFTGGTNGSFTATFANVHYSGEPIIGLLQTSGASILPVPAATNSAYVGLVLVDMGLGAGP